MPEKLEPNRRTLLKGIGAASVSGLLTGLAGASGKNHELAIIGVDRDISPKRGEQIIRDHTSGGAAVIHRNSALNTVKLAIGKGNPNQRSLSTSDFIARIHEAGNGVQIMVTPNLDVSSVSIHYSVDRSDERTLSLRETGRNWRAVLQNVDDGPLTFWLRFESEDGVVESDPATFERSGSPEAVPFDAVEDALAGQDEISFVEEPSEVTLASAPNDPKYPTQSAPKSVNAPAAWDTTYGSTDVTIGIVDTGVDYEHEDLASQFRDDPGYDFADDDTDPINADDDEYHGTCVSGLASAATDNDRGVAGISNSELVNARILRGKFAGVVPDGIQWAADQGADIINMSVDTGGSDVDRALEYAHDRGALLVAAAGNESTDLGSMASKSIPHHPKTMAVSALNPDDDLVSNRSWGSNYGDEIAIAAPGRNVLTTYTDPDYIEFSGTSGSSPIVAGVAGLVKDRFPEFTNVELRRRLENTAADIGLHPYAQGNGKVDAGAAVAPAPFPATASPIRSDRTVHGGGSGLTESQYHVESLSIADSGDVAFIARLASADSVQSTSSYSTTADAGFRPDDPTDIAPAVLDKPKWLGTIAPSTKSSIKIDWSGDDHFSSFDHYNVYVDGDIYKQTQAETAFIHGLEPDTSYDFEVTAVNTAGEESPKSDVFTTSTATSDPSGSTPSAPTDVVVEERTTSRMVVNFDPVSSDDVEIGEYRIKVDGEVEEVVAGTGDYYYGTVEITGLTRATTYEISVSVVDMLGQKAESDTITASTTKEIDEEAPHTPSGVTVAETSPSTVTLGWDGTTDDDGQLVPGYVVYADSEPVARVRETGVTVTNLTEGQSYDFQVAAIDDAGNRSELSAPVTATASESTDGTQVSGDQWTATVTEQSSSELHVEFDHETDSSWVDLHYTVDGTQLNVRMTAQEGFHTYVANDLAAGDVVEYWFTYEEDGMAYDSSTHSYTFEGGATSPAGVTGITVSDDAGNESVVGYDQTDGVVTIDATGSDATVTNTANLSLPCWLAVDRTNGQLTARVSSAGTSWTDLGVLALDGTAAESIGLAATAGEAGELLEATYTDVLYDGLEKGGADAWAVVNGTNNASSSELRVNDTQYELEGGDGFSKYMKAPDGSFALQPLGDEAWTSARVVDIENHTQNTAGGVGVRSDDGSDTVAIEVDRDGTVTMVKETDANTRSRYSWDVGTVEDVGAPVSLALRRAENTIQGYFSTDGSTWEHVGTATLDANAHLGGLYTRSGESGQTATVTFESVVVSDEFDSQDVGSVQIPGELTIE